MAYHKSKDVTDFDKLDKNIQDLIRTAVTTRQLAYCPYSKFSVGAALLADNGSVFSGCNVESKVYSPTVCAERTAICKAVSEGRRMFTTVAVVALQDNFTAPCGVCREVLSEFCDGDMDVYMSKPEMKSVLHMKLSELLPLAFT